MESRLVQRDFIGLNYGNSGVGKTLLTAAIAQELKGDGGILHLDSSDGFVTLEDWPEMMVDTDSYRVDDYRELPVIGDALLNRKKGFTDYTVCIMDEVSSWYTDMLHAWVREDEGLRPEDPIPEIEGKQYGPPTHALLDIVNKFHKTEGLHLLLVSHEQVRGNADKGTDRYAASLPPAFMRGINQRMHLVARVEAQIRSDGYKRSVQTRPSRKVDAKSRISLLDVIEEFENVPGKIGEWINGGVAALDLSKPQGRSQALLEDEDIQPEDVTEEAVEVA